MDFTSLPKFPSHAEAGWSQADRLREERGIGWEAWVILALLAAAFAALGVLVHIWVIGRAAGGLAG